MSKLGINRRTGVTLRKGVKMGLPEGKYMMDCYNQNVLVNGISGTITTRVDASASTYLLEVYE